MVQVKGFVPTVDQISTDRIFQISQRHWSNSDKIIFQEKTVELIYQHELIGSRFSPRRIVHLEFSRYLENYLWPAYSQNASDHHVISIVALVNEKYRERIPAWDAFSKEDESNFASLFLRAARIAADPTFLFVERNQCLLFLTNCVACLEVDLVRKQVNKIVSLRSWYNLSPKSRRDELLNANPGLKKYWRAVEKKEANLSESEKETSDFQRDFLVKLITTVQDTLDTVPESETESVDPEMVRFCERFAEFAIEIESVFTTRRFVNALLHSSLFVVRALRSNLTKRVEGELVRKLVLMLDLYQRFEINDFTGEALTEKDMTDFHYSKVLQLQKAAFKKFRESMKQFYLLNVASVDTTDFLNKHLNKLSEDDLFTISSYLGLVGEKHREKMDKDLLIKLLVHEHARRPSQIQRLNESPLYPTESVIWDTDVVPEQFFSGEDCLALYKLNLQFLTLHDYLLRNFTLFKLETTCKWKK